MPDAITTPLRSGSTSGAPACAQASRAAIRANCPDRSIRLVCGTGSTSEGSTATGAAMDTGSMSTHSSVSTLTPDRPASRPSQVEATSPPSGVVAPRPVTTTRCASVSRDSVMQVAPSVSSGWSAGDWLGAGLLDVGDGVADGREALDVVVGDAHAELLLRVDHDGHHRQRVDVEVVGERLVRLDVAGGDAGLLVDDLCETLEDLLLASGHLGAQLLCASVGGRVVLGGACVALATADAGRTSGQDDDLGGVDQPGAETDEQRGVAALDLAGLEHPLHGEGDGGGRRVAGLADVAGHRHVRRQLQRLDHRVGDAHVGLVGDEGTQVLGADASRVERLLGHRGHLPHRPAEDLLALHGQGRELDLVVAHVQPGRPLRDGVVLGAVGAPDRGADRRLVARPDNDGPGTVAEDEGGRAVVGVGEVRELLAADHQDVLGAAAAHHVVGQRDAVAEAGAGGGQVGRSRTAEPEALSDRGGGRRCLQRVGDGRQQHRADLLRADAGLSDRLAGGRAAHVDDALVGAGPAPALDAGALADPLVGGVDALTDLGVGDDARRAVAADAEDARVGRALRRGESHQCIASLPSGCSRTRGCPGDTGSPSSTSHSTTVPPCGATTGLSSCRDTSVPMAVPGSSTVPSGRSTRRMVPLAGATSIRQVGEPSCGAALPWRAARSRAASRSSGVFRATVSTSGSDRLTRPVRVPAGGTSISAVTPSSPIVCMHRSQRTGLLTWLTIRESTSRPWAMTAPSRLEMRRVRGSWTLTAFAYDA